jgi:hypothetical protein
MKSRPLPFIFALLAAVLSAAAPWPTTAEATNAVLRCRAADGTIGYTDKSCAVLGAEPVPMSSELMTRLADAQQAEAISDGLAFEGSAAAAAGLAAIAPGRRGPASGCARSPTQLAMDLHGALALGDVNRVAESYHFAGMSSAEGERTLDRLQRLTGREVIDSSYFDASIIDGASMLAGPASDSAGTLQLVLGNGDGGASAIDFDVHRYAGCYFVSF